MKVLVIYDLVSEEQKRAIIEMTEDEYNFFKKAHNIYINADDEEDIEKENVALVIDGAFDSSKENIKYCKSDTERKYFGKWKSDLEIVNLKDVDYMICCGIFL